MVGVINKIKIIELVKINYWKWKTYRRTTMVVIIDLVVNINGIIIIIIQNIHQQQ